MLGRGLESLIPSSGKQPAHGAQQPKEETVQPRAPQQSPQPVLPPSVSITQPEQQKVPEKPAARPPERPRDFHEAVFQLEVAKIKPNPHQPRRDFNEESLRELADSIREFGIIQPIIVRKIERDVPMGTEVEYELIAGERRLLAAKLLGFERVPAIIRKVDVERERLEMAVIENLQREGLNPIEVARAFAQLQDEFRLTQREIASRLGKSRETVTNTVRLLDLPSYIQDAISSGELSESHGRLLLAITDQQAQKDLFDDIRRSSMTVREAKRRIRGEKEKREPSPPARTPLSPELKMFEEKLESMLGAPVTIEQKGDPPDLGGKILITFYSEEELKNILERLGGSEDRY